MWTCEILLFSFHFLREFDLFEIGDTEEHFGRVGGGGVGELEVEEVVVLGFVVGGVGHGVVEYTWTDGLGEGRGGVHELDFGAFFVVEVDHVDPDDCVLEVMHWFFVSVDGVLQPECFLLDLRGELGEWGEVGFESIFDFVLDLLFVLLDVVEEDGGDWVVGVHFEVGGVLVGGVQVDLGFLEDFELFVESSGDLFGDVVEFGALDLELVEFFDDEVFAFQEHLLETEEVHCIGL